MRIRSLFLLTTLAPFAIADVEFTSPAAGNSIAGGGKTLSVTWKESGDKPPISSFTTYTLFLCAGGNTPESQIQVAIGGQGTFSAGNTASGPVAAGFGGTATNAYFLKIISTTTGGTVTNYSPRFSLTGMTGTFPPNVAAGIKNVKGTTPPGTENNVADSGAGAPNTVAPPGAYAVPFLQQTGPIMYAPMQGRPGSKITAKVATPAYPTSSVKIAAAFLPPPKQITTHTLSMTASTSSHENTASPAAQPLDDMQKYLARWRD
ncbi:hypothetical protein MMC07_004246 [Pseudocyphellaria aurata]|nr:hypothetical protein [Pseudocyphellaria aurata]